MALDIFKDFDYSHSPALSQTIELDFKRPPPVKKKVRFFSAFELNPFKRDYLCDRCGTMNHLESEICPSYTCGVCFELGHYDCSQKYPNNSDEDESRYSNEKPSETDWN